MGSLACLERSGGRNGNPFQCACLENPMDRGAWWAVVRRGCKELDRVEHGCTMYMKQIANKDLHGALLNSVITYMGKEP